MRSVNSIRLSLSAFSGALRSDAGASGFVSFGNRCGGKLSSDVTAFFRTEDGSRDLATTMGSLGSGSSGSGLVWGFDTLALAIPFESPKRCALPITALRVTPPSSLAISAAVSPSNHIRLSRRTRSWDQGITLLSVENLLHNHMRVLCDRALKLYPFVGRLSPNRNNLVHTLIGDLSGGKARAESAPKICSVNDGASVLYEICSRWQSVRR